MADEATTPTDASRVAEPVETTEEGGSSPPGGAAAGDGAPQAAVADGEHKASGDEGDDVHRAPLTPSRSFRDVIPSIHKKTRFTVRQADFSWRSIGVRVEKTGKTLLEDISGYARPGEVLGILGPSGSGKTTLLNALVGKGGSGLEVSGRVLVNGKVPGKLFKRMLSFVAQENSLLGVLTVKETMDYAARLSGAPDASAVDTMVADTLHELGMESTAETKVGDIFYKGISGGQKRRLSIGVELLKQPSIVAMDEPTSGLDSAAAFGVMKNARELAAAGRTVVATIHQPSSEVFAMCDKVLLLANGRTVYFGPTNDVVPYFAALGYPCPEYTNVADYVLSLINSDFETHADVDGLCRAFKESRRDAVVAEVAALDAAEAGYTGPARLETGDAPEGAADSSTTTLTKFDPRPGKEYASSFWTQFVVLASRNWLNNLRNPGVFWVRIVMYVGLAFMLGTLYLDMGNAYHTIQDRFALLFFAAAFFVFMSVSALPFFIQTRAVFMRERGNGAYAIGPYVTANFVTFLPGLVLIAMVASCLVYFVAGLNDAEGRFWIFTADLFLSLCVAESFMLVIAAVAPHYIIGIAVGAATFGCFMACEGFMIQRDNIPDGWIWVHYIAFHTYSFRLMMFNEFDGQKFECPEFAIAQLPDGESCSLDGREDVLKPLQMDDVDVGFDMLVLCINIVVYQLIFYLILKWQYGNVAQPPRTVDSSAASTKAVKARGSASAVDAASAV